MKAKLTKPALLILVLLSTPHCFYFGTGPQTAAVPLPLLLRAGLRNQSPLRGLDARRNPQVIGTRDPSVTGGTAALELSLSVARGEYAPGETVEVTMTLRNRGPAPFEGRSFNLSQFDFAIFDEAGRQLGTWSAGKAFPAPPPRPIRLAPGQSLSQTLWWNLTVADPKGGRLTLTPGCYSLEGFLAGRPVLRSGGERFRMPPLPLRTPRVHLTIR